MEETASRYGEQHTRAVLQLGGWAGVQTLHRMLQKLIKSLRLAVSCEHINEISGSITARNFSI
jgi:hypothetical protein